VLFPIKKILNIDKYFVCESRDMCDESGTYIILLKLKKCSNMKFKSDLTPQTLKTPLVSILLILIYKWKV
jgi:hypothetical protein